MFKKILKYGVLVIILVVVVYGGVTFYANFTGGNSKADAVKLPDINEAKYTVLINNTGNLLFTSSYEQFGKVYVLHGYWEMVGQGYNYRNRNMVLDPAVFGPVTIQTRGGTTGTVQK